MGDLGFLILCLVVIAIFVVQTLVEVKIMGDVSKLNASVAKLSTDVDTLISSGQSDQAAIDTAQQAVDAIDSKVVAATPAPPAAT